MILNQHLRNANPWLNDFGRIFDAAIRGAISAPRDLRVMQHEQGWTLEVDLPGVSRSDLVLEVKDRTLHLRVREDSRYRLPLGDMIDAGQVAATFENGVLAVRLLGLDASKEARRIEIH